MINEIIDGISEALYAKFGDNYEIYTNSVEQGLNEPCFSIVCVNPAKEQFLGKRYYRANRFCIHYFPEDSNDNCLAMIDELFDCLEYITIASGLRRGTNMSAEVTDGVLNFMVDYNMFTVKETEKAEMETITHNGSLKG